VAGDYVFVSGALSVDSEGQRVKGPERALAAALARLEERLATAGLGLEHVVQMVYYATNISLRDQANRQFIDVFLEPRPARSFVGVAALPYGASVEIEAIAYVHSVRPR
jgi:2-iminobutanoate/2-iminopropanoate deaminase